MRLHEITQAPAWQRDPLSNPEFKRWFGNSVVKDKSGRPLRVYHGSRGEIEGGTFRRGELAGGLIFFSTSPKFASGYAQSNVGYGAVTPCYLHIEQLFDHRTREGQQAASEFFDQHSDEIESWEIEQIRTGLYGQEDVEDHQNHAIHSGPLSEDEWNHAIKEGNYPALEVEAFNRWLFQDGFDGLVTFEGDAVNFAVYKPDQIKSAISNSGKFSKMDANIGEARQGN